MRLRLLTLNAGLLKLFGRSIPTPFVEERLARLPWEIERLGADIVVLQEVYGRSTKRSIADPLRPIYPFAFHPRARRSLGLQNALMTLSRFPMHGEVELFRDAPLHETILDSKGLLTTTHELPDGGDLRVINAHTTAGGMFHHPESAYIDGIRAKQIAQMLDSQAGLGSPIVLGGDMNAGPGVSDLNFRQILAGGLVSLHDLLHPEAFDPTWDPANPLNREGPHKHCPPQRIDHLFARAADLAEGWIRPISSTVCLKDAAAVVASGDSVSISDHYGLLVELEVGSRSGDLAESAA